MQPLFDVFSIQCVVSNDAVAVEVLANLKAGDETTTYVATGTAKRHPDDKFNDEIGALIAYGRALQKLGRRLESKGHGLTKHYDDMKRDKQKKLLKGNITTSGAKTGTFTFNWPQWSEKG